MAFETPRVQLVNNNMVRVHHPLQIEPSTYLTANVAATGTTLTVANNYGFEDDNIVLLEDYGTATAEICYVNGTPVAGTSLVTDGTVFAHSVDCPVRKIFWDEAYIGTASTTTGTPLSVAGGTINVGGPYSDFLIPAVSVGNYYFVRFYNSMTGDYSPYTAAIAATDFESDTVGFVRRAAFENVDTDFGGKFSTQWVYDSLYQCEQDILQMKPQFSCMVELNYDLGDITINEQKKALPSDISDTQTNKSILGVRISGRDNMRHVDNMDFHRLMYDVHHTTLATTANVGDVTLTLTDSNDFKDSGSVLIAGTSYAYTANNRTTNVLSGLTALSAGITAAVDIWQGISDGEPRRYTIVDGYIYWDVPPSDDWEDMNVWIDYFKKAQRYSSDTDKLLLNDPGLYIYWLEKEIKRRKADGELTLGDVSGREYDRRKALFVSKDKNIYDLRAVPSMPLVRNRRPFQTWR